MFKTPLYLSFFAVVFTACAPAPQTPTPVDPTDSTALYEACQLQTTPYTSAYSDEMKPIEAVLYQLNVGAYGPEGNLYNVVNDLDRLESLGINVLWLSPIFTQGENAPVANPFLVRDYYDVDPDFGTLQDLRMLTDRAHQRGIRVLLTVPVEQVADDHPWTEELPNLLLRNTANDFIPRSGDLWTGSAQTNVNNEKLACVMSTVMKHWLRISNADGIGFMDGRFWSLDLLESIVNEVQSDRPEAWFAIERNDLNALDAGFQFVVDEELNLAFIQSFGFLGFGMLEQYLDDSTHAQTTQHRAVASTVTLQEYATVNAPRDVFGNIDAALMMKSLAVFAAGTPMVVSGEEVGHKPLIPYMNPTTIVWDTNAVYAEKFDRLISAYTSEPAMRGPVVDYSFGGNWVIVKKSGPVDLFYLANSDWQSNTLTLPAELQNQTVTDVLTGTSVNLNQGITLGRYAYKIYKK